MPKKRKNNTPIPKSFVKKVTNESNLEAYEEIESGDESDTGPMIDMDSDGEPFCNSEDEYAIQSGGDDDQDELGDDSVTLEKDDGDQFDPIEDIQEPNDNDEDEDEDEGDEDKSDEETDEVNEDDADYEDADDAVTDEEDIEEIDMGDGEEGEEGDDYTGEAKTCYAKNLKKNFIVLDEDDSNMYGKMKYRRVADKNRISDPILTYYECVAVIGTRAQQFNFGSKSLVKGTEKLTPPQMAYVELMAGMTPIIIRRRMPGKKFEDWKISELQMIHPIEDEYFVPKNFNWESIKRE